MAARNSYRWEQTVTALRQQKGRWLLLHQDVPLAAAKIVRQRRHPALRLTGEVVRVSARNVYVNRDGQRRCDLYLLLEDVDPDIIQTSTQSKEDS